MPMIDAYIPQDALTPQAEERLLQELTEIVLRLEGFDPSAQHTREATWIFVHRPEVFVAGVSPSQPRYQFTAFVPEGQFGDAARAAVVKEVTAAVARAEGRNVEDVSRRVWVFPLEVQDGRWGSRGIIQHLPDILGYMIGDHSRHIGEQRLADRRRRGAVDFASESLESADVK